MYYVEDVTETFSLEREISVNFDICGELQFKTFCQLGWEDCGGLSLDKLSR